MNKNKTSPKDTELTASAESREQTKAEGTEHGEQPGSERQADSAETETNVTETFKTETTAAENKENETGAADDFETGTTLNIFSDSASPESDPAASEPAEDSDGSPAEEVENPAGSSSDAADPADGSSDAADSENVSSEAGISADDSSGAEAPESLPPAAEVPGTSVSDGGTSGSEVPGEENSEKKKNKKKNKRSVLAFWLTFLILAGIVGGFYYYGYQYCRTHFMPGTKINGYDCSDMTAEEAQRWFDYAAENYVLNIRFRGGATEMLSAEDMGFSYKPDGSIDALLQSQDELFWPKYYLGESSYTIVPTGNYDPEILENSLLAFPELQKENMEKPEDAYIQFRDGTEDTDGAFEIVPDVKGSTINLDQLAAAVGDAAARYEETVDAEEVPGAYKEAAVTADDARLISRCNDLNDMVGASITYVMPDNEKIRLNADVMKDWLVKDEKGRLYKDEEIWDEKLWEFLQILANNGNTLGMRRHFNATLQGPIIVSGGDYGYMVNQIVEHDLLLKDIENCTKETRRPSYYLTPYNEETENDGIGTTYIEADLSAQHVWCYISGRLVMDCDCVSGTMSDGHATQAGVYGIMFMKKDAMLRGLMPNSSSKYEYETEVKYWMPFYTDVGFHDAWWRTEFGGDIYIKDGSHGCINLPPEAAEELYSYCDEKMPVVVYY